MEGKKHLSELLLEELVNKGILRINHDKAAAQKVVRSYFVKVHRAAIQDEKIARNKQIYSEPNFLDI